MKSFPFLLLLALVLSPLWPAHAGEIITRPLGVDADGKVIEGHVYQADRADLRHRHDDRYIPVILNPYGYRTISPDRCRVPVVRGGTCIRSVPGITVISRGTSGSVSYQSRTIRVTR